MPRHRWRRRGGKHAWYPHHGIPLVEGSLIPQGQRPCVCGNSNRSNGSEFPDSSITNIFHSSLPSFCPLPPRLSPPLSSPFYHPFSTFSASVSFHSPFHFLLRSASTTNECIFFSLSETINGTIPCWLRSVKRTLRRRFLSSVNPAIDCTEYSGHSETFIWIYFYKIILLILNNFFIVRFFK